LHNNYDETRAKKAEAIRIAEEMKKKQFASGMYKFVSLEISEVFNAVAGCIDCVGISEPQDIRLVFNGKDFDYEIPKSGEGEDVHYRTIQATVNKICLDRYNKGYSPIPKPLECHISEVLGKYRVSVIDMTTEEAETLPRQTDNIGQYLGILKYDEASNRFFVNSCTPQIITIGKKFQVLYGYWHTGEWIDVSIKQGLFVSDSSKLDGHYVYKFKNKIIARII
jgi:hypothetical protein